MSRTRAVVFDMDGVIVDSEPLHERAFLEVVEQIGYRDTHGLNIADFVGRSDYELWNAFVERHNPSQTLEELLTLKRLRVIEILRREQPLYTDLPELIRDLATEYKLALASGSERVVVDAVLAFKGLVRSFQATVSGSEIVRGKPAPDIFLRAAELLEVLPTDCWAIEDSKPGIAAGLAAGMRVIAISNTHPLDELGDATHVVSTYHEIRQLLLPESAK
jgi:HAD superfamily hydrolase (TIGR01509 family)